LSKPPLHHPDYPGIVAFYPRGHVAVKSPVPVWFPAEEALGMLLVPSSGALSLKVIYTKRAKEFFIGQLLRWSGMQLLYVAFLQTF
jgi:hypothetical protein